MSDNATRAASSSAPACSLLPCPFCGGEARICGDISDRNGVYVVCMSPDCWCSMGEHWDRDAMPDHQFRDEESAVAAWNRRANAEAQRPAVAGTLTPLVRRSDPLPEK